ncbi:hypothetical protein B0F90DRAFT_1715958 [Multifurca ochricompacta]|uniref:Uncharacterized protein n=1 Tax=Multifurca ochricompacta TaxID=376703 RepID=A0AAD4M5M6_9AGAM|nr:hypothetical protein B0F90DRAFT_1715958 [Multifurca ochricompacta]
MSLLESVTLIEHTKPLKSSNIPCDAYVLAIAAIPSYYAASASAPSHKIYLFDQSSLRTSQSFQGHQGGTTSLRAIDSLAGVNKRVVISSGKDGVVRAWDDRTGAAAIEMKFEGKQKALLSCDVSSDGLTVAAGTELQQDDALIVYWSHNLLLSGSTDGLVCVSDAEEPDEDEAVLHVGNLGSSISQAGWIPCRAARTGLWAATDMETFSLCPSVHTQARTWITDYLIGCHPSEETGLSVLVGSNERVLLHFIIHSTLLTTLTLEVTLRCSGTQIFTTALRLGL